MARIESVWTNNTWNTMGTVTRSIEKATGVGLSTIIQDHPQLLAAAVLSMVETKLTVGMDGRKPIQTTTARGYVSGALSLLEGAVPDDLDVAPILRAYMRALAKDGAMIPNCQARPLQKDQIQAILADPTVPLGIRAVLFVCWKTASRVADALNLELPLEYDPAASQLLTWFRHSKTATQHQYSERFIAIVDWSEPNSTKPPDDVLRLLTEHRPGGTARLESIIGGLSYTQLAKHLKLIVPREVDVNPLQPSLLESYTAHSPKRGSLQLLWALQPILGLDLAKIQLLGSHKTEAGAQVSETSMRYAGNMLSVARCLGTQDLTKHL